MSAKVQRLRVRYGRGAEVRYVSHLDMMRFWERALRRAHIPVAYSEGFTPHPQLNLGAPLSVGMTSNAELLDVFLSESRSPGDLHTALQAQMPAGMRVQEVVEVPLGAPSLASQVRAGVYALHLRPNADVELVERSVRAFLAAETFPWEHRRDKDIKRYDLRPLVLSLDIQRDECATVIARLRAEEGATARADQVAAALGISDLVADIERVDVILAQPVAADG